MKVMTDHYAGKRRMWVRREQEIGELRRVYQDDYLHQQWCKAIEYLRKTARGWDLDRLLLARKP